MKEARHKRLHIQWFHLSRISRKGKSIKTSDRYVVARGRVRVRIDSKQARRTPEGWNVLKLTVPVVRCCTSSLKQPVRLQPVNFGCTNCIRIKNTAACFLAIFHSPTFLSTFLSSVSCVISWLIFIPLAAVSPHCAAQSQPRALMGQFLQKGQTAPAPWTLLAEALSLSFAHLQSSRRAFL